MLDLRRVRVFNEVAERRSFSAAAAALDYTQPAVSHHIAQLEKEIGLRLINRGARPMTLTEAGETLHRAAAVALAEFDRAELDLQALATGTVGRVTLGSVTTGLRSVVPPAISAFRRAFPDIDLVLGEELTTAAIVSDVRSGTLDVGIIVVGHHAATPDPALFTSELLLEQPMLISLPERHRLARRRHIELRALQGEHFLLPAVGRFPDLRAEIDTLMADAGVTPSGVTAISDDIAGSRLIAAGVGVGIAPGLLALGAVPPGITVAAIKPPVMRSLHAITVTGRPSAPVRALLQALGSAAGAYQPA